jgi:hypothetical protein
MLNHFIPQYKLNHLLDCMDSICVTLLHIVFPIAKFWYELMDVNVYRSNTCIHTHAHLKCYYIFNEYAN